MTSITETMGTSHERLKGWRSRFCDKFYRKQQSATSPGPSIVNNSDVAGNIVFAGQFNLPPKSVSLTDEVRDVAEANIDAVPQVRLELTLADNTQQVICLDSDIPAEQWTDVWSIAYREAVARFDKDFQQVIIQGRNFQELLQKLEKTNDTNKDKSIFRKGLVHLQKPLEIWKMVLDTTEPFLSIEPTAAAAAGVVQGATTVAIWICGAASELSEEIHKMLDCIPYIDKCDALDWNEDGTSSIHMALVDVYTDLLNFYLAASKIVNSKYHVLKAVASQLQAEIPTIVREFIKHAGDLNQEIHNATLELAKDVADMVQDRTVQELLGAKKERDQLHINIQKTRSDDACSWILKNIEFKNWYSAPASKRLLLHGSMGCGKTVTAAYIIDEVIKLNSCQVPMPLTCFHYCKTNAAGNSVDILSSLILQMLDQKGNSLKKEFCNWHKDRKRVMHLDPTQSFDELKAFLKKSVDSLERPLYVILDGLDECTSDTLNDLIDFIAEFSEITPPVKFCLTFRHIGGRMSILTKSSHCIQMIEDPERDGTIARYMVERNLRTIHKDVQTKIAGELANRANGSAIWLKASIDLIKRHEFHNKKFIMDLLKGEICYTELPGLYAKLFSQMTEGSIVNEELLTKALEILAVAKRPLLVQELKWALAMQMSPPDQKKVLAELDESKEDYPVLTLLRPFIICIGDDDIAESHIRLAHESIRELVLASSPSNWKELSMKKRRIHEEYGSRRRRDLEANLLRVCVDYLMLDEIDQKDLFDVTQTFLSDLPFSDDSNLPFSDDSDLPSSDDSGPIYYDPSARGFGEFFAYSSCYWIEHWRHAAAESFPSISTIITLTSPNSKRFRNWYQQFCRPDCTVRAKLDDNTDRLDPLVFISLHGPNTKLQELLKVAETDSNHFITDSVDTAIATTIANGEITKLKCLIEHFRLDNHQSKARSNLIHYWKTVKSFVQKDDRNWDEWFDLVLPSPERVIEQEGNELLCEAVKKGCFPVVKKLFEAADRNPALRDKLLCDRLRGDPHDEHPRPFEHQSVGVAAYTGDIDMLRYLLSQTGIEVHLNHINAGGHGVLHIAALAGDLDVLKLLVPRLKTQVNRANKKGDTALHVLVFNNPPNAVECAKVLLTEGEADVLAGYGEETGHLNSHYLHPLRGAVRGGYIEMCHVLIEHGHADPRVALEIHDGEASLLDYITMAPGSGEDEKREKRARDILAILSSSAGTKPSREVGPRGENRKQ